MNNGKFDQWFDDTFEKTVSSTSISSDDSKKQSWQKVQAEIYKLDKRKTRKRHFQLATVVAASVTAGAIIFNPPAVTQAISPVYQSIKDLGNGVVNIIIGTYSQPDQEGALTSPPPAEYYPEDPDNPTAILDRISEDKSFVYTLEEAKSKLSFPYPDFQIIPERFQLVISKLAELAPEQKTDSITMTYKSSNDETMRIMLQSFSEHQMITSSGSVDTEVLTLNNDIEAFYTPGRFNDIQFIYNGISIRIYGNLTKEELIDMTESLPQ